MSDPDPSATYGIGYKLLKKMGHKEGQGLGREDNQGIVAPLEATPRSTTAGLGFVDPSTRRQADRKERKEKKGSASRRHDEIEDDSSDYHPSAPSDGGLLDLRGPQARFVEDVSQGVSSSSRIAMARFPELHDHVAALSSAHERKFAFLTSSLQAAQRQLSQLENDMRTIRHQLSLEELRVVSRKSVKELLLQIKTCLVRAFDTDVADELSLHFRALLAFDLDDPLKATLDRALSSILFPYLKPVFQTWQLIERPLALQFALPMLDVLASLTASLVLGVARRDRKTLYEAILYDLLLTKLRVVIHQRDEAIAEPSLLAALASWWPHLPAAFSDSLALDLIAPKLSASIKEMEQLSDLQDIYPWLLLLSRHTEVFFPALSQKIAQFFSSWQPSDRDRLSLLADVLDLLPSSQLDALLNKAVLPPLSACLRRQLRPDIHVDTASVIEQMLSLHPLLPYRLIASLLDKEYFPSMQRAVYAALTTSPDYDLIADWYEAQKALFPPELLLYPSMETGFRIILDIINGLLDNPSTPFEFFVN